MKKLRGWIFFISSGAAAVESKVIFASCEKLQHAILNLFHVAGGELTHILCMCKNNVAW